MLVVHLVLVVVLVCQLLCLLCLLLRNLTDPGFLVLLLAVCYPMLVYQQLELKV